MSALGRLNRGETNIDFRPWWRRGLILSSILVVVSILSLFTRGLNLGIDFEGGVSWEVKAPGVSVEQTRDVLEPLGLGQAKVQLVGSDIVRVQGPNQSQEKVDEVRKSLATLAAVPVGEVSVSTVGPSWGDEITKSAVRALVVFLLAVFAWLSLRLEWKMAAGAIIAVIHDVIISVGVYSVFQFEVTPPTVIAFLTILGYSIYDTVVVFDKVQENQARVGLASRMTYTEMTSLSMNQVLLRSINTSVVSLLPVLSMLVVGALILGAVTLEEFSLALGVGMIVGAYSSIFVATPVVVWFKEREPKNRLLRERLESTRAAATRKEAEAAIGDGAEVGADGGSPAASGAARPAPARSTSTAAAARAGATPSGAIPPRPRKKGKKR
ncbi:MAG: protein translocase subunit SecF [Acidimicrobiales bacterium]